MVVQKKAIDSINLRCYCRLDGVMNPPDLRTIVISKISTDAEIETIIKQIDKVSPVLMGEYVVKYSNPQKMTTDELVSFLRDPEFNLDKPSYLIDREVQIHETDDDKINVIYLDSQFKPKKSESYTLLMHKEAFPRVYSPTYVPEAYIDTSEPMVYRTNKFRPYSDLT